MTRDGQRKVSEAIGVTKFNDFKEFVINLLASTRVFLKK